MKYLVTVTLGLLSAFAIHLLVLAPHISTETVLNRYYSDEFFGVAILFLVAAIAVTLLKLILKDKMKFSLLWFMQIPVWGVVAMNTTAHHNDLFCVLNYCAAVNILLIGALFRRPLNVIPIPVNN